MPTRPTRSACCWPGATFGANDRRLEQVPPGWTPLSCPGSEIRLTTGPLRAAGCVLERRPPIPSAGLTHLRPRSPAKPTRGEGGAAPPAPPPRGRGAPGLPVGGSNGGFSEPTIAPRANRDGVRPGRPAGRMSRPGAAPGSARPAPPRSMVVGALRPHSGRAPPWSFRSGDAGGSGRIGGLSSCRRVAAHGADCLGRGAELASPPDPATIGSAA